MAPERKGLATHLRNFGHKSGVIVNENPAFIYMKVTKAAGTSVLRHTLEVHPEEISPFHIKDHREKTNKWFSEIDDEKLASYYFFTVVRNPWERFVSLAYYVKVPVENLAQNFDEYMKNPRIAHHAHQQWICSHLPNGDMFANRICRMETLQQDMNIVFDELNLPRWEMPVKNSTTHKSYRDEISKDAREVVERVYGRDIEVFGYEF